MSEKESVSLLGYLMSSEIRSYILFSLMEDSKTSKELKNDARWSSRNVTKALKRLVDLELVYKTGSSYSLTISGRLIILNIINFLGNDFKAAYSSLNSAI